jgi:outer membrane protein assembly factor BamB
MTSLRLAAVLAALVSTQAALAAGVDWPQFRGPDATGITPEANFKADWPAEGPPVAWRKNVGIGFGSISVVGDRLYVAGHSGGKEHLYCLDTKTGEQIWTASYPGKLVDNLHEGGPASTPTIDDGKIHLLGREGQVHCFDAKTGKVLWQADLQKLLGVKLPAWGFAGSALIEGNMAIYQSGATVAFDKNTGKVLWTSKPYKIGYSTPYPFTLNGKRLLASLNCDVLAILDPKTGNEIAAAKWDTRHDTSACSPVIAGDKIFLSAGYGKGSGLFQLTSGGLKELWTSREMSNHMNSCVLIDGVLYGIDGNSNSSRCELVAMDMVSGKIHWKQRGFGCGSVIAAGDKLIVLSEKGELATVAATPAGYKEIARAKVLDGKCWTHPVLSHGRIYARDAQGNLVALDVK